MKKLTLKKNTIANLDLKSMTNAKAGKDVIDTCFCPDTFAGCDLISCVCVDTQDCNIYITCFCG